MTRGLLRDLPRFRRLWLSKTISGAGTGIGRVALVLLVAPSGPGAVSIVLVAAALPLLLGPLAGAVADRVDQRRLLAACEAGQGVVYAVIAATRPPLAALIALVVAAGLLSTFGAPAGKSAVRRLVPGERRPQANALLGLGSNMQIVIGPAIGGVLAGLTGATLAFAVNAASFAVSALLLSGLGPLPPLEPEGAAGGAPALQRSTLLGDTMAGLRYTAGNRALRGLVLGMLIFITFAAVDNVALVFLVKGALHGSGTAFGLISAAFGIGMVGASAALTAWAGRRPPGFWLIGGVVAGAAGAALTGVAPDAALAGAAQVVAGAGNTADLVGTDTIIQQRVPARLLGRAFGTVYASAQLGSALSSVIAGPLVALAGARTAFLVAAAGSLLGIPLFRAALRPAPAPGPEPAAAPPADPAPGPLTTPPATPPLPQAPPLPGKKH